MAEIGKINNLRVLKKVDFGVYLDADELGEILLPSRYVPNDCATGDFIRVFIHTDTNDLLIATTETPKALVDQCAFLKVVEVNKTGAFLDWGLSKDLLVPYSEQIKPMQVGSSYCVFVFLDEQTDRIAASCKLHDFISEESDNYKPGQPVELLITAHTDMGYKAVINDNNFGMLYKNEVFQSLRIGQRETGYIKAVRPDKKIDLSLQLPAENTRDDLARKILEHLKKHGGTSGLTDKSPPDAIYRQFQVSKASYKKALGRLYSQKLIQIEKQQITLL